MKRIFAMLLSLLMTAALLTACGGQAGLQDGYYTAQMSQFSHGWKEYITILVKGGSIISVEYNAENASGFPLAKGFYEHMGFQVYKRTELDEQGNPYPLLYMRLD